MKGYFSSFLYSYQHESGHIRMIHDNVRLLLLQQSKTIKNTVIHFVHALGLVCVIRARFLSQSCGCYEQQQQPPVSPLIDS